MSTIPSKYDAKSFGITTNPKPALQNKLPVFSNASLYNYISRLYFAYILFLSCLWTMLYYYNI